MPKKINMEFIRNNIKLPSDTNFHGPSMKFGSLVTIRALEKAGVVEVDQDVKDYFDREFGSK